MACLFDHKWGWPRKRGEKHMQVCLTCGSERESKVQFDGPRYRVTQTAATTPAHVRPAETGRALPDLAPAA